MQQRSKDWHGIRISWQNTTTPMSDIGTFKLEMGTIRDPSQGKLGSNWEGPYRISSWQRKETYHLETLDGQKLQHPWNIEHLGNTTSRDDVRSLFSQFI